jgi:hypothetical protein
MEELDNNKIYYIHSNIKLIENYIKIIKEILEEEYKKELIILNNKDEGFENKLERIIEEKKLIIIDCVHYIVNKYNENELIKKNLERIIIFNLEHLTKRNMKEIKKIIFEKEKRYGLVIDYNEYNKKEIEIEGYKYDIRIIEPYYKEIMNNSIYKNINVIKKIKQNDICYLLENSEKRREFKNNLLKEMNTKTEKYIEIYGNYGDRVNKILKISKILINIHYDSDYELLESIRCYEGIQNRCIVISERCINEETVLLKDWIIFEDKDKIIKKVEYVLNNYEEVWESLYNNNKQEKLKNLIDNEIKKIKNIVGEINDLSNKKNI